MPQFVHLNVRSDYSVVDSILKVKEAVDLAKKFNQPAVIINDLMNLSALVKFYTYSALSGIKPIIASDIVVERKDKNILNMRCLCQTHKGYLNLSELISKAYLENQSSGAPIVKEEWLFEKNSGLILMLDMEIVKKGIIPVIQKDFSEYFSIFKNRVYLEVSRIGKRNEDILVPKAMLLAERASIPVVATNKIRFPEKEDFEAHEIRTCINQSIQVNSVDRILNYTPEQYFKTTEEMTEIWKDYPGVLENSVEIAKRCNLDLTLDEYFLPDFPVPEGMTEDEYFIEESKKGLEERLNFLFSGLSEEDFLEKRKEYDDRLKFELDIIIQMGFPGYFFIVADFIQWAKDNDVPVGPGRGSGAGSLVAYSLKITDLDPLEYDLLFERFLNPERVSMPDFDVDFCMNKRDLVIDYVSKTYGKDHVSQIITFGTMAAKAVIRDVGRALGENYGFVDSIAKLVPNDVGIKLFDAVKGEPELARRYSEEEETRKLLKLALRLEGTIRNTGKHAGGVVISPKPLHNFCPVSCEKDGSSVVTQLDKNDVETAGLVKFDFLGLRTLTIIDNALIHINKGKSKKDSNYLNIESIPLVDKKVFDLIKTGRTTGVFQLESPGMQNLIVKLKPDTFEDLIALVALYRPGPLESGMVDNFIKRKHGKEIISYPDKDYQHESLKAILSPTYGVILYQEQVMQIAQVLAGYTLGEADMLRRAMGKKKPEEMEKQRSVFQSGAVNNGIDGHLAMKIFDLVEKFAGYGFNKSHSAAYALVSYQSAWLKTHYPEEFMAAQISSDMDNVEKMTHMINECDSMNVKVIRPNINKSEIDFWPDKENHQVIYGLGGIKGLGDAALDLIAKSKKEDGPFKDLFDFCKRVKLSKRMVNTLINSGAFDCFSENKRSLSLSVMSAIKLADQSLAKEKSGQVGFLFDDDEMAVDLVKAKDFHPLRAMENERLALGRYFSAHPVSYFESNLPVYSQKISQGVKGREISVVCVIDSFKVFKTKTDQDLAILNVSDESGFAEVSVFGSLLEKRSHLFKKGEIVMIEGGVKQKPKLGPVKMFSEDIYSIFDALLSEGAYPEFTIPNDFNVKDFIELMGPYVNRSEGFPIALKRENGEYLNSQVEDLLIMMNMKLMDFSVEQGFDLKICNYN